MLRVAAALLDPELEGLNLFRSEFLAEFAGGICMAPVDSIRFTSALRRLASDHRAAPGRKLQHRSIRRIQSKTGLALRGIESVAGKAIFREDRAYFAVEIHLAVRARSEHQEGIALRPIRRAP